MDVRIGVTYTPKELEVDLGPDADKDAVKADVEKALSGDSPVLWLTDKKGRTIGVPAEKLSYVELDPSHDDRRVGFGLH